VNQRGLIIETLWGTKTTDNDLVTEMNIKRTRRGAGP